MIKRIAINGGAAVNICPAERPSGIAWDASGILFGQGRDGIKRVAAARRRAGDAGARE